MYDIKKQLISGLPQRPYKNGVGKYTMVVAHATSSYAPNENEVNYSKNNWNIRKAFPHILVDWDDIIEIADTNYLAWGAGNANPYAVHIELCQTKDGNQFSESWKRYTWTLAYFLFQNKLGVIDGKTLVSHDWVSKNLGGTTHSDPIDYLKSWNKTWNDVVVAVKKEYQNLVNGSDKLQTQTIEIILNGKSIKKESYPLIGGHLFAPLREAFEMAGYNVQYDNGKIILTKK